MKRNNTSANGISFTGALQILFIALKLIGVIDWPWKLVLLPIELCLALGAILIWLIWMRDHRNLP